MTLTVMVELQFHTGAEDQAMVTVTVTLIGWVTLLKGVAFIALEPMQTADLYLAQLRYGQLYPLYVLVTLVLGAYLCYAGFGGKTRRLA
jgi:hypothetical protein